MKTDFIIVGQGLAGSLIAWQLMQRGQRVLVVDRDEPETSSKVSAGLVTPIAGARFNTAKDLNTTLPFAKEFYWNLEEKLGTQFFNHLRIVRLFQNNEEKALWKKKRVENHDLLSRYHGPLTIGNDLYFADDDGFEMKEGGWLNLPLFLEQTRQVLLEKASYAIGKLDSTDIRLESDGVHWKNITATKGVIFCQGWRGNKNHFFDWIPMNPAQGEILDITCEAAVAETRRINKGGWLLPLGNGKFRAGSNYNHQFTSPDPSEKGLGIVKEKIEKILRVPYTVTKHRAAIRPIIRRSQIVMGTHPTHTQVAFFNGLGSKGVLNGPYYSNLLCSHLLDGAEIPDDMDIRKNF